MNEKKKMLIIICSIAVIVIAIIFGSVYEGHKSDNYLKDFYSAFESSENKLVMIGRDNCSWCQLFKPYLDFMSENYGFEYLYVNTNELTSGTLKKLLKTVGVDEKEFGTPLTLVVKDSEVVDSLNGYVDEPKLFEFLKKYDFISSDAKLMLNYLDYSSYKKILKSDDLNIVVIGQTTCGYCIKARPILNKIVKDYGIKINYLNITELSDDDSSKFNSSLEYLSSNEWGTPLTLILKKGEVIDSANGLLDYDGYVKLFKDNNFIK